MLPVLQAQVQVPAAEEKGAEEKLQRSQFALGKEKGEGVCCS